MKKKVQKNTSTPIPVNNIPPALMKCDSIRTTKDLTRRKRNFPLTSSTTASPFSLFACLALPPVFELCCLPREVQEIDQSICHSWSKCCDPSDRAQVAGKKSEFYSASIHYLLFLPFIWHCRDPFSQCKRKTWRYKHNFCFYKVETLWRSISYTVPFGAAATYFLIGWYFLWHSDNHVVSPLMKAREINGFTHIYLISPRSPFVVLVLF